jgi:ABC-type spermidine/putrescine transport system permease subunit II
MNSPRHRPWFSSLAWLLCATLLYLPLIVLVANSFNASKYGGRWEGFTWSWYEKLAQDSATLSALGNTLKIALLATLIATGSSALAPFWPHIPPFASATSPR